MKFAIKFEVISMIAGSLLGMSFAAQANEARVTQLIVQPAEFNLAHAPSMNPGEVARFSQMAQMQLAHVRAMSGRAQVMRLPKALTLEQAEAVAARLVASGLAVSAEPDRWVQVRMVPNDPRYIDQWHYQSLITGKTYGNNNYGLNLPAAWDISTGSDAVVVAVLDTGLLPHKDIDSNILDGVGRVVPGYDFISDPAIANDGDGRDNNPTDPGDWVEKDNAMCGDGVFYPSSWHGTHVAGTIGAATNNALGVSGITWSGRILPVRVLGVCGGQFSDIIDAMRWSAGMPVPGVPDNPHPAKVLNMSFTGVGKCGAAEQAAIDDVLAKGAMLVVAAGNSANDLAKYPETPAVCRGVITVAASDQQGQIASYSNYGARVDLTAPGGEQPIDTGILSTADSGIRQAKLDSTYSSALLQYQNYDGTSMATPHVSGLLALMLAVKPSLTSIEALDVMRQTATPFPKYSVNLAFNCTTVICGAGIANAQAALSKLSGAPAPVPPPAPEPVPTPPPAPEPSPTPPPPSSGGGSMDWLALGGLLALGAALQRRRLRQTMASTKPDSAPH